MSSDGSAPRGSAQSIIAHMNKDHRLSLEDYLYVYGNVPITDKISNVRMKEFDLDHMTLIFQHADVDFDIEKVIPFDPPLSGLKEARDKLVSMAKDSAANRGFSYVRINEMSYPGQFVEYFIIAMVMLPFFALVNKTFLQYLPLPSSIINLLSQDKVLVSVIIFTVTCHALECYYLLRPRLNYHRVPTDFLVEWYFFGMIEGYGAVRRFNDLAHQKLH